MAEKEKPHPDQLKREKVPTIDDVPTQYRPLGRLLMIVPLPEVERIGTIIVPDRHRDQMNEGHVVAKGPECVTKNIEIGDCVVWGQNNEYRMEVDGQKFVNVPESACIMGIPKATLEESAATRKPASEG